MEADDTAALCRKRTYDAAHKSGEAQGASEDRHPPAAQPSACAAASASSTSEQQHFRGVFTPSTQFGGAQPGYSVHDVLQSSPYKPSHDEAFELHAPAPAQTPAAVESTKSQEGVLLTAPELCFTIDGTSPPEYASQLSLVSLAARTISERGDEHLKSRDDAARYRPGDDEVRALVASARAATRWCGSCDRRRFECEFAADEWRRAAGWDPSARVWPDDSPSDSADKRRRARRNSDAEWEALYVGAWRRCLACEANETVHQTPKGERRYAILPLDRRAPVPYARFETAVDARADEPSTNDDDDDDKDLFRRRARSARDGNAMISPYTVLALARHRRSWTEPDGSTSPLNALVRLLGAHPGNRTLDGFALTALGAALTRAVDSVLREVFDSAVETAVCRVAERSGDPPVVSRDDCETDARKRYSCSDHGRYRHHDGIEDLEYDEYEYDEYEHDEVVGGLPCRECGRLQTDPYDLDSSAGHERCRSGESLEHSFPEHSFPCELVGPRCRGLPESGAATTFSLRSVRPSHSGRQRQQPQIDSGKVLARRRRRRRPLTCSGLWRSASVLSCCAQGSMNDGVLRPRGLAG